MRLSIFLLNMSTSSLSGDEGDDEAGADGLLDIVDGLLTGGGLSSTGEGFTPPLPPPLLDGVVGVVGCERPFQAVAAPPPPPLLLPSTKNVLERADDDEIEADRFLALLD